MPITGPTHWIQKLRSFFTGGSFPVFTVSLLLCWEALLVTVLLIPASPTPLGAFAESFRIWCFGYDPATGRTEWAYVMAMILPQLMMAGFIAAFWWEPLRVTLRHPRAVFFNVSAAALLVAGSAAGLILSGEEAATGELPFPAEELRIANPAPQFSLVNQAGEQVELAALRGKVVLLTAVYASCPHTCPAVLARARASVSGLSKEELDDLRVIGVTMDPANDSSEVLSQLASNHGLDTPVFNLVTGPVAQVEDTLDRMQIARKRDPETGVIDHVNLFLLIDRTGKLAYRLGLGERQQRWLTTALGVLLDETPTAG
ncbi:MAG: SCO family protein [bacterium]|nr:SCO family protein [bacterium]